MATVVNRGSDNRGAILLSAVAGFLSGMKDKRMDRLQSELLREIEAAPDEATAAALYGDERFTSVVNSDRFPSIVQATQMMHKDFEVLFGYTEDGEQVPFSVPKGSRINEETFSSRGFRSSKAELYYADDLDKTEDLPLQTPLGAFRSRGEAMRAAEERNPDGNFNVLAQAEANISTQAAMMAGQNRRADVAAYLAQERFRIDNAKGYTPFSQLQYDFANGLIDEEFYEAAKKRLTFVSGLTPDDVASEYLKDAPDDWANVENMSSLFKIMADKVIEDPRIITNIAAVPRLVAALGAELKAISSLTGMTHKSVDEYDWGSLAAKSNELKGMILDAAMVSAKADDQTARSLSDKDLDRFLDRVGRNISDVPSFIKNLANLAERQQRGFYTRYEAHTRKPWAGKPFTQISFSSDQIDEQFNSELKEAFPGIVLPETREFD